MNNQELECGDITKSTSKKSEKKICCGIYGLRNKINGKWYVGQSVDVFKRWSAYKCGACRKQIKLYRAIKKYGYESFEPVVLEECSENKNIMNERETFWINYYDSHHNGYNATTGGEGMRGWVPSEETKKKIRKSKVGQVLSESHKQALTTCWIGKKQTDEHRQKRANALKGKPRSEETKVKLRAANLGKKHSLETIEKMKKRKPSAETTAKRIASYKATCEERKKNQSNILQ